MNIDFIKVPFSNNPSMQKYDGPLFNQRPDEKYLSQKQLQLKKYGKDLFGQTDQYESSDLNNKVSQTLGLEDTESLLETAMQVCLLYTSPSPRDRTRSRMPSSA